MDFVNASGKPIDIEAAKAAAAKQRRTSGPRADAHHKGWSVAGFSPSQIQAGRAEHEELCRKNLEANRATLPWDESRYMRNAKPSKVRAKPFETRAAAEDAKRLAERYGWKGVMVSEVSKGKA